MNQFEDLLMEEPTPQHVSRVQAAVAEALAENAARARREKLAKWIGGLFIGGSVLAASSFMGWVLRRPAPDADFMEDMALFDEEIGPDVLASADDLPDLDLLAELDALEVMDDET